MPGWTFDIVVLLSIGFLILVAWRISQLNKQELSAQTGIDGNFEVRKKGFVPYPRRLIRQAGISPDEIAPLYWTGKILLAILLPLCLAEVTHSPATPPAFLVLGLLGFFIPDLWFVMKRNKRRNRIENGLSFFIDLIVAFLRSGMTLAQSFDQAAKHALHKNHPLAREVTLVANELDAGMDRSAAFFSLADRTGVDGLHRLAAVLTVGFRSGSAVHNTLKSQSDLIRTQQWERGEKLINRKSLVALFPMMLVSFPLLGVLIFFPAGVQLVEAFSLFRESLI